MLGPAVGGGAILLDWRGRQLGSGGLAADSPVAMVAREDNHQAQLALAARHVAAARRIVAQQHERIARLKARGSCTRDFERTLSIFVGTLQILEAHERALRKAAAEFALKRWPPSRFSNFPRGARARVVEIPTLPDGGLVDASRR